MADPSTPSDSSDRSNSPAEYDDGRITCTATGIRIRTYYMWGAAKKIEYAKIRSVRSWQMGTLTGKWRIWGSGDFKHWFNLDPGRPQKSTALVFRVGKWWLPVITPDEPDKVIEVLHRHGIDLSDPE